MGSLNIFIIDGTAYIASHAATLLKQVGHKWRSNVIELNSGSW
jgi:hypothetical protein